MAIKIIGLTSEEVDRSLKKHGDNSLARETTKGFFRRFLDNLSDPIIKILIIALTLQVLFTFGHSNFFEIGGIVAAILISTIVSTASEYRSELAFKKIESDSMSESTTVLRDNKVQKISISQIVIGDIIYLSAGEEITIDDY